MSRYLAGTISEYSLYRFEGQPVHTAGILGVQNEINNIGVECVKVLLHYFTPTFPPHPLLKMALKELHLMCKGMAAHPLI